MSSIVNGKILDAVTGSVFPPLGLYRLWSQTEQDLASLFNVPQPSRPPAPPAPQTYEQLTDPKQWTPDIMFGKYAELWKKWDPFFSFPVGKEESSDSALLWVAAGLGALGLYLLFFRK